MESKTFYGRRRPRVPLFATAIAGGDIGESDDEHLLDSDEEDILESEKSDVNENDRPDEKDSG